MREVLHDPATSRLDDRHKALFRFIDRVNLESPRIQPEELAALRAVGWTDEELYFAITTCALFNFYNRWIDATGVHALTDEAHKRGAVLSARNGYVR